MTLAIWVMERGGFDVMILTKVKIFTTAYCRNRIRYKAACLTVWTNSAGGSQGSARLVTREKPVGWRIESTCYRDRTR